MVVGEVAEYGGADPGDAEGKAEEQAGDGAHLAGDQPLGIDDDGRERRGQDEADDEGEDGGPEQIGVGQQQGEGRAPEDGSPDHLLAVDPTAEGTAELGAGGDGEQEDEQVQLG